MESPSSVDLSDENILGSLWAQLLLQFSTDCFETFQMFSAWNEDMHVVWNNPLIIFSHFFCFVNLIFFRYEMLSVYRQWVPCGRNSSYSFPPIALKHCTCFQHGMKMCMWFWLGLGPTLIIVSHFFCVVNLVSFFKWNAIKLYRQWVPCGRNCSYSFQRIVLKLCRCFLHEMKICMWLWYNTLVIFFTFSALWTSLFSLHEILPKCVDSGHLVGATPLTVLH